MLALIYTASPQGLIPGRSGFCTVAMTEGFPPNLISPLENLSGYKAVYPHDAPEESRNPTNYCYQLYNVGATPLRIVSKIGFAGLSYTGRSNNLAHHLLWPDQEFRTEKILPAEILACQENFTPYSGTPGLLPPRKPRYPQCPPERQTWKRLCGNQDWAIVIAERFRRDKGQYVVLQFSPLKVSSEEILALVREVTALLTPEEAIDFTFTTYCYHSSIGSSLFLRAYAEDSPFLASYRRLNPNSVIVLGEDNPMDADAKECLGRHQERLSAQLRAQGKQPPQQDDPQPQDSSHPRPFIRVKETPPPAPSPASSLAPAHQSRPALRSNHGTAAPSPVPPAPLSHKRPIALFVILGVILLLAMLALGYFLGHGNAGDDSNAPSRPQGNAHRNRETPEETDAPSPPQENSQPGKKDNGAPNTQKKNRTVVQQEPQPSHDAPSEKPAETLPLQEETKPLSPEPKTATTSEKLAFFEAFQLKRETEIPLPKALAMGGIITVEIDGIGDIANLNQELLKSAVRSQKNKCEILPVHEVPGSGTYAGSTYALDEENETGRLTLTIQDGKLKIQLPESNPYNPKREQITKIAVGGTALYQREFSPEFLQILQQECPPHTKAKFTLDWQIQIEIQCDERIRLYDDILKMNVQINNPIGKSLYNQTLALQEPRNVFIPNYSFEYLFDTLTVTNSEATKGNGALLSPVGQPRNVLLDEIKNAKDFLDQVNRSIESTTKTNINVRYLKSNIQPDDPQRENRKRLNEAADELPKAFDELYDLQRKICPDFREQDLYNYHVKFSRISFLIGTIKDELNVINPAIIQQTESQIAAALSPFLNRDALNRRANAQKQHETFPKELQEKDASAKKALEELFGEALFEEHFKSAFDNREKIDKEVFEELLSKLQVTVTLQQKD